MKRLYRAGGQKGAD